MAQMSFLRTVWVGCLVGTVVAVLATAIPLLGILFAILGAPFLPILLLNAAFVAMVVDALVSRIWLLLLPPLLWFGGYEIVAAVSHAQVTMLRAAAASQNAHAKAHWNRAAQSVRIDKTDTSSEFWASDITPGALVETYGLDVAYDSHGNSTSAPGRVVLDRHHCPGPMGAGIEHGVGYSLIWRGMYPSHGPMQRAKGVCMLFENGATLPEPPLVIALASARTFSGLIDGIEQDITVSGPDQPAYTLRAVQVAPLPWLPMPIIGCNYRGGLDVGMDTGCHAEFRFISWRGQDDATPMAVLARALGLKAMTIEQRLPGVEWE